MFPTRRQQELVAELKAGTDCGPSLPIANDRGEIVGRLLPVNRGLARSERVIQELYRSRKQHMTAFLTVFEPHPDKTRAYLEGISLAQPDRILFAIEDAAKDIVGFIGLCNICECSAELDNVLRGKDVGHANFMVHAQWTILRWAFASLDVPLVYLRAIADNARAIRSYGKAGFRAVGRTALVRQPTDDGYRLVPGRGSDGASTGLELVRMEIDRSSFLRVSSGNGGAPEDGG